MEQGISKYRISKQTIMCSIIIWPPKKDFWYFLSTSAIKSCILWSSISWSIWPIL